MLFFFTLSYLKKYALIDREGIFERGAKLERNEGQRRVDFLCYLGSFAGALSFSFLSHSFLGLVQGIAPGTLVGLLVYLVAFQPPQKK